MPSPFPGMDPYLEGSNLWPDLHLTLTVYSRGALNAQLQSPYHTVLVVLCFPGSNRRWHRHVKIIDRDRRTITAIEFVSPEIKSSSPERAAYLDMRQHYLEAEWARTLTAA